MSFYRVKELLPLLLCHVPLTCKGVCLVEKSIVLQIVTDLSYLVAKCEFVGLFINFLCSLILLRNYQKKKHEDNKRQEHKDVGSKPRKKPHKGGNRRRNSLLIESNQRDISKTQYQEQNFQRDPSQSSSKLSSSKQNQQNLMLVNSLNSRPSLKIWPP